MKTTLKKSILPLLLLAAMCLSGPHPLRSQSAEAKGVMEILTQIRDANKELIGKQAKTLDALDDLQKTAEQLRIVGKRS